MQHIIDVYVQHIITTADITEELNCVQPYPVVHFEDETCKVKCGKGKINEKGEEKYGELDDEHTEQSTRTTRQWEQRRDEQKRGDIPDNELRLGQEKIYENCGQAQKG